MAPELHTLLIVSHVVHYRHGGQLYAYGPYAREIDLWAQLFPRLVIAAPCRDGAPPGDCAPLTGTNIAIAPQRETGGRSLRAKAAQLLALPVLVAGLARAMRQADAIHVRCPGNLGLLGALLAPLFSRYLVAKYAGQWSGYPGEPWSVRLQRAILRSSWWRGPVTVYGDWPGQPAHITPFFTSLLSAQQLSRAGANATRPFNRPLRVLYVGRLSAAKNVDILLAALSQLQQQGLRLLCSIVGDGPMRGSLQTQAQQAGLQDSVEFVGALGLEQVLHYYGHSDILVLASESEGWPKAIVEGMAHGLVCIGSQRGLMPQMLGAGRGLLVPPRSVPALAQALQQVAQNPEQYADMRARAAAWAGSYSIEGLRDALRSLLCSAWQLPEGCLMAAQPATAGAEP